MRRVSFCLFAVYIHVEIEKVESQEDEEDTEDEEDEEDEEGQNTFDQAMSGDDEELEGTFFLFAANIAAEMEGQDADIKSQTTLTPGEKSPFVSKQQWYAH